MRNPVVSQVPYPMAFLMVVAFRFTTQYSVLMRDSEFASRIKAPIVNYHYLMTAQVLPTQLPLHVRQFVAGSMIQNISRSLNQIYRCTDTHNPSLSRIEVHLPHLSHLRRLARYSPLSFQGSSSSSRDSEATGSPGASTDHKQRVRDRCIFVGSQRRKAKISRFPW